MKQSFGSDLKIQIKVALPWYISVVTGIFAIFLPTILGCNTYQQIGIILDRNFSFLAIFIFANIYYIEIQQKTEENFYLFPDKKKILEVYKRIMIRTLFVSMLVGVSYYLFTLQDVYVHVGDVKEIVILEGIFAVISNVIFFGGLTCFVVNLLQNLWIGSGIVIVIWLILSSAWGKNISDWCNVFAYGELNKNWVYGKIFALCIGVMLFCISTNLIKRSPYRYWRY